MNTYALSSETRVKNKLQITVADHDTVIKRLLYAVTDLIEKGCGGRRFERDTYTQEIYSGAMLNDNTKMSHLILKHGPVTAVSAFEYDIGTPSSPSWVDFEADNYRLISDLGILEVSGFLPRGTNNLRVSYTAGYLIDFDNEFDETLHTLPYELSDLCERIVVRFWKKRKAEGKESEIFNDTQINWLADLFNAEDRQIMANYTRNNIAI